MSKQYAIQLTLPSYYEKIYNLNLYGPNKNFIKQENESIYPQQNKSILRELLDEDQESNEQIEQVKPEDEYEIYNENFKNHKIKIPRLGMKFQASEIPLITDIYDYKYLQEVEKERMEGCILQWDPYQLYNNINSNNSENEQLNHNQEQIEQQQNLDIQELNSFNYYLCELNESIKYQSKYLITQQIENNQKNFQIRFNVQQKLNNNYDIEKSQNKEQIIEQYLKKVQLLWPYEQQYYQEEYALYYLHLKNYNVDQAINDIIYNINELIRLLKVCNKKSKRSLLNQNRSFSGGFMNTGKKQTREQRYYNLQETLDSKQQFLNNKKFLKQQQLSIMAKSNPEMKEQEQGQNNQEVNELNVQ